MEKRADLDAQTWFFWK